MKIHIFVLIAGIVQVDQTRSNRGTAFDGCSTYGFNLVEAKFGNESILLCLKKTPIGSSSLASRQSTLIVNPALDEDSEDEDDEEVYPLSNFSMAHGFPLNDPASGSAEGYIGDDHHFYGVLHIGNRTLHADPYGRDDPNRAFGAFDSVLPPRIRRDQSQAGVTHHEFPYQIEDHNHMYGIARARICDLLLLADKEFFELDANSSLNNAVQRMMHAVAQSDIIFRNSDFDEDGIPDNIGFSVKYILVLTSNETNSRVFGNLLDKAKSINGRDYLMKFARLRRLSEVCLGVAFSGLSFKNRTLGLSFTSIGGGVGGSAGGLCDRRAYGRSYNTLAISHGTIENNERVPERIAALTLSHEMGHSFGAHHDDIFPNPECRGHLMGAQSSSVETGKNIEFSVCSKRLIAASLSSMSYCLTEEDRPYCGNGIVEKGEACDCGLPSKCSQRDPCCTPRSGGALIFEEGALHKDGCSVAPTALCHPSQGLCCLPNCEYADLSESGIDCMSQDMDCTCSNDSVTCHCGLGGRCLSDGTCHAAECAMLGLRECQCVRSPGGALGESHKCGACCLVEQSDDTDPKCIGAEQAAYEVLAKGITLPMQWPGDDYVGPNVTIRLCRDGQCRTAALRAWRVGETCVTRGAVGRCSSHGVCSRVTLIPRSNIYPDVMHIKLASGDRKSSARSLQANALLMTVWDIILYCNI